MFEKPSAAFEQLLRACGSYDPQEATAAQREFASALTLPLQQGVLFGDVIGGIYEVDQLQPGAAPEYPLDFIQPGNIKELLAYTVGQQGAMPYAFHESDYVMVPTYDIGASQGVNMKYVRNARFPVVQRMFDVLRAMFVRKLNNDGFHTLLAAALARNLSVADTQAVSGLFTKRLVNLMQVTMTRNAGGNSTSVYRGKMTDLYMSPEALGDIRSWDLTQIDDVTRRQIFLADGPGGLNSIYGVTLHELVELGATGEWQTYFLNILGGSLPPNTLEIVLGLDLLRRDSFIMPVREMPVITEDTMLLRQRRMEIHAWAEVGFSALDARRVLLGAA